MNIRATHSSGYVYPPRRIAWWALSLALAFAAGWAARPTSSPAFVPAGAVHAAPHPTPSGAPTPDGIITQTVSVYFSPNGGSRAAILDCINQASASVKVAMYSFTDTALADALARAHRRGVTVEIVLDRAQQTARGGQAQKLIDAGVPVHFDTRHQLQHNKFAVIDGATVISGSQNWTQSGETRNAENTLVLCGDHRLAGECAAAFAALVGRQPTTTGNQPGGM